MVWGAAKLRNVTLLPPLLLLHFFDCCCSCCCCCCCCLFLSFSCCTSCACCNRAVQMEFATLPRALFCCCFKIETFIYKHSAGVRHMVLYILYTYMYMYEKCAGQAFQSTHQKSPSTKVFHVNCVPLSGGGCGCGYNDFLRTLFFLFPRHSI